MLELSSNLKVLDAPLSYSLHEVVRLWGTWGSYCNIPKALVYLLEGNYRLT